MASRPFLVKDIAQQAGLSTATVDRVLNGRPNVRAHTARRVAQAIDELQRQSQQLGMAGRKFMIDLVMETPARFAAVVRGALEAEMAALHPVVFRARCQLREVWTPAELVAALDHIGARGSHGVLLKAADLPEVAAAVDRLVERGIPVVTVVTDLTGSRRLAYVGLDNHAAGATAAYLIGQWLGASSNARAAGAAAGDAAAGVLVSLSSVRFRGEEERVNAFRQTLGRLCPGLALHDVSEGQGRHDQTANLVRERLSACPELAAVYSIGGANRAILGAFEQAGRPCRCFVGHDLDADNLALLRAGRLSAVLHHDLRHDMRQACLQLVAAHGVAAPDALTRAAAARLSSVVVVTPYNLPENLSVQPVDSAS
ncbi:MAG: hypothetical protein RIQ60_3697 [Pseudomonadota bacterium]|jgi:LacI family transcriptional regulator